MAKYDEFGRPIYETAEEYNKAHKRGSYSRTYDSPEGNAYKHKPMNKMYRTQRTSGQYASQNSYKTKSMSIGIGICFIIIAVLLVSTMFNMVRSSYGDEYEVFEEDVDDVIITVEDEHGEFLGDNTTPLPEGNGYFV